MESQRQRIGVISDTHGVVRTSVHNAFKGVDQILHAGDIDDPAVLMELNLIAPVIAIRGNMDSPHDFPHLQKQISLSVAGLPIVLIHDLGRLKHTVPRPSLIVHGHTHKRCWGVLESEPDDGQATRVLNPGCAGERTREPSVAILTIAGMHPEAEFISLR